jgi:hypothetical protein
MARNLKNGVFVLGVPGCLAYRLNGRNWRRRTHEHEIQNDNERRNRPFPRRFLDEVLAILKLCVLFSRVGPVAVRSAEANFLVASTAEKELSLLEQLEEGLTVKPVQLGRPIGEGVAEHRTLAIPRFSV